MKITKVWKITRDKYSLCSLGDNTVEYIPQKWTWPKVTNSKLFCFDTKENALRYFSPYGSNNLKLWEALAVDPEPLYHCAYARDLLFTKGLIERFWNHSYPLDVSESMIGTLVTPRLRLIKRIYVD